MTVAENKTRFTPDDLLNMPDAVGYELVDGQLVERKMGTESSIIAMLIGHILSSFVKPRKLGFVAGSDCSYQCFADEPDKVRRPDVSFIAAGRARRRGRPPKWMSEMKRRGRPPGSKNKPKE
jgi:Uma2 family endonuclease